MKELEKMANETLTGDVRDFLLNRIRDGEAKVWEKMTEQEQRDAVESATDASKALVRQVVKLIASEGNRSIGGTLEQVTAKDGLKAVITMSKTAEYRHELIDAQGLPVLVSIVEIEKFVGEKEPVEIDLDEPEFLPIDEPL